MSEVRSSHAARGRLLIVAGAIALIGAATLGPQSDVTSLRPWYEAFGDAGDGADAVLNIGLFVPLGLALAHAGVRRGRAVLIAFAVTLCVELLQGAVVAGRQPSVSDIACNTVGGWLGHVALGWSVAAVTATPRRARQLAMVYGVVWMAATLLGASLLRPALPHEGRPATCGPDPDLPDCFAGRLLGSPRLEVAGEASVALDTAHTLVVGTQPTIVAVVEDRGDPDASGLIAGAVDTAGDNLLVMEQQHDRAVLYAQTRGHALGLRTPGTVLPGVFGEAGRRVTLTGGVTGTRRWIAANGRRVELVLAGSDGWRLLFPWTAQTTGLALWGAMFHLVTLAPLGMWAARALQTSARGAFAAAPVMAVLAVTVFAGFAGGSRLSMLEPASLADWGGAAAGVLLGALVAGWTSGFAAHRRVSSDSSPLSRPRDAWRSRSRQL